MNNKQPSSNELAKERTTLAMSRTVMASQRTYLAGIKFATLLAGISIALKHKPVLYFCLLIILLGTAQYYYSLQIFNYDYSTPVKNKITKLKYLNLSYLLYLPALVYIIYLYSSHKSFK